MPQELAELDLGESLDKAKALIEGNALKGDVKHDWWVFFWAKLVGVIFYLPDVLTTFKI